MSIALRPLLSYGAIMRVVDVTSGISPLVLSMPHCGTHLPEGVAGCLNKLGQGVPDTDWWIDRLYDFADEFHATTVRANLSRYVIDLNRDPSGNSLYPGRTTTGLCPVETFEGEPIYLPDREPTTDEIDARRRDYFDPYHHALEEALAHAKRAHGFAVLYDCHSIRSVVPRLFDGTLATINIGTNGGASCAPVLEHAVVAECAAQDEFSHVVNQRFKGGWITRHYGQPSNGVHALQVELTQSAYMEEVPPWTFDDTKAHRLRTVLKAMVNVLCGWDRDELGPRT